MILISIDEAQILDEKMGPPSTRFYNALHQASIRHAVLAMLLFSIVALLTNMGLPYLVSTSPSAVSNRSCSARRFTWLTLPRAWMCSHILTSVCLLCATFGDTFISSVFFVALLGISWALTQWAPFAIISAEIAIEQESKLAAAVHSSQTSFSSSSSTTKAQGSPSLTTDLVTDQGIDHSRTHGPGYLDVKSKTATTMAVHNIAIAMPQMISAVVSSVIFWLFRSLQLGDTEAMAWVLRVGIVAGACAAYLVGGIE